jgi:phenylalanyl-tRNA synthetase beta chain
MLFLKSWLEEYIDLSGVTNEQIQTAVTLKSSEVEEVREISDYFGGKVVVGKIANLYKHPDADSLNVFDVLLGGEQKVQIVSAAANAREGLIVPVALDGATLPGLTIVPRKMRGIESQGMCCGKSELLRETEYSADLWELNDIPDIETKLGHSVCNVLPAEFPADVLFDIKVLPNRIGVIGSYLGMAREIALCLGNISLLKVSAKRLEDVEKLLTSVVETIDFTQNPESLSVSLREQANITKSFALFDVKISGEGEWRMPHELQKRLFLSGVNSVGGVVDVSNYLLHDIGQPMHFFSKSKVVQVSGGTPDWSISRLETPRQFEGLGQLKNVVLPAQIPVITDGNDNILAIPGVSGGASTRVDSDERELIVEIANFPAEMVARTCFALKYRSDGAKIWAGGVNQQLMFVALLRLRELLGKSLQITPILFWSANSGVIESLHAFISEYKPHIIEVNLTYLASRLDSRGLSYWQPILETHLQNIGSYEHGKLEVETFYSNLTTQDDVLEEVVRLISLDNIQETDLLLSTRISNTGTHNAIRKLKNVLTTFGVDEVLTRPFVGEVMVSNTETTPVVLKPYRSNEPFVRDNLFYSLIDCAARNMKDGLKEPKVFEVNSFFTMNKGRVVEQKELQAILVSEDPYLVTSIAREIWAKTSRKQVSEYKSLGTDLKVGKGVWYETNVHDEPWISISEVSNSVKKKFEIPLNKKVWSLNVLLSHWNGEFFDYPVFVDESPYPTVIRSYTFVLGSDRLWSECKKSIEMVLRTDFDIAIEPVERFSKGDKDNLTVQITYSSQTRTLKKEEIEQFEKQMIERLGE